MGNITSQDKREMKSPVTDNVYTQLTVRKNERTPTNNRCLLNDPRSPTVEISRTPIQVENTPPSTYFRKLLKIGLVDKEVEAGYAEQIDPNESTRLSGFEEGVEVEESCEITKDEVCKNKRTEPRTPLKPIAKRNVSNVSSPAMFLRYKRMKEYVNEITQHAAARNSITNADFESESTEELAGKQICSKPI